MVPDCTCTQAIWQRSCQCRGPAGKKRPHRHVSSEVLLWSSSPRHPNTWSDPVTNHTALLWERSTGIFTKGQLSDKNIKKEKNEAKPDNVSPISNYRALSPPTHSHWGRVKIGKASVKENCSNFPILRNRSCVQRTLEKCYPEGFIF